MAANPPPPTLTLLELRKAMFFLVLMILTYHIVKRRVVTAREEVGEEVDHHQPLPLRLKYPAYKSTIVLLQEVRAGIQ